MEYLCGKAIGNDVGISLMGVDPASFAKNPALQRLGGITRQYEALRHAKYFPESVKARLRVPGDEFTLDQSPDGKWQLRPARYAKHKVESLDDWTARWTMTNAFAAQPLRVRLEVLLSAEPYDATNAITVAGFTDAKEFPDRAQANGVKATLESSTNFVKAGAASGCVTATNSRPERAATWASLGKTFTPPLNLGGDRALGVWVHGDGQGEVLVEMESGSYLEFNSATDCKVFGPDGAFLQDVKIEGAAPILTAGANQLRFDCEPSPGVNPRVRITTITSGAPLAQ